MTEKNIPEIQKERYKALRRAIAERVLVLDGSMGVMIASLGLSESQFRGSRFVRHASPLRGNNDVLNITRPDDIRAIHRAYLRAGADIIETNTFNSNAISQAEYGTDAYVAELNRLGVELARAEAVAMTVETPWRPRFVAGSIGPTPLAASLSSSSEDVSARAVDFDTLAAAAYGQVRALVLAGTDMLLLETAFDALNLKAMLHGVERALSECGADTPVAVSITVSETSGRMLSGHDARAVLALVSHVRPVAVGFNCSAGIHDLEGFVREFADISPYPVLFYPNAGLPDAEGRYADTPALFAERMEPLLRDGMLNVVGGCCGTTPEHIAEINKKIGEARLHKPSAETTPWLASAEAFEDNARFINVGERCNVAGSRKFLTLIKEQDYDGALAVARKQVADGAMMLDVNLDDGMLDTVSEMRKLLRYFSSDAAVMSVPWMIDTSSESVMEEALKNTPGRPVVNSISLKHGEEEFLRQARMIRAYGAAVVVMAFDEQGQADTLERRKEICGRSYRLLTEKADFDPRDIILDPNVLTICTGMPEHRAYGRDFIETVRWIKASLPGARTSGGVSNLSFAFRGNNYVRQAMHAVFLYHAIQAGLDMAILDPGSRVTYDSIPAELLERLEDVVLCRRDDADERLLAVAANYSGKVAEVQAQNDADWRCEPLEERIAHALVAGDDSQLPDDIQEALCNYGSARAVVEGPLMQGMERVGALFEKGRLFLPQVVKSALIMHRAVDILKPHLEAEGATGAEASAAKAKFVLATVKGDVHDIGKNIAALVLKCNNFEVIDLGVQVDAQRIVDAVKEHKPQFIGLSGLISPSLGEMVKVAEALTRAGIDTPLMVGGAATSDEHTRLKIRPAYRGTVVRVNDASQNPVIASRILNGTYAADDDTAAAATPRNTGTPAEPKDLSASKKVTPAFTGQKVLQPMPVAEVREYINWTYFFNLWKVPADSPEGRKIKAEAETVLDELAADGCAINAQVAFYPAHSTGSSIVMDVDGTDVVLPTPRQRGGDGLSLCDYVAGCGCGDHVGVFMVTVGQGIRDAIDAAKDSGDPYRQLLLQSVADRLAEAASECVHRRVRTDASLWGYAAGEDLLTAQVLSQRYRGIRPAVGYPSLPDQMQMHTLARVLNPGNIDVAVTENGALWPSATVAGFYLASEKARYFTV